MLTSTREPRCERCAEPLDLSQPDTEDSARLLGVCPSCGRWYARIEPEGGRSLLVSLPVPTPTELMGAALPPAVA